VDMYDVKQVVYKIERSINKQEMHVKQGCWGRGTCELNYHVSMIVINL
jgi:hypothetical protein